MSTRKFRCGNLEKPVGSVFRLEREEENHLFKILRASPGELPRRWFREDR